MFLSLLDSMNRRFEFSNRKVVVADVRRERSKSMEPFLVSSLSRVFFGDDYTFKNASHKTANASETTGPNRIDHFAASEVEIIPEFEGGTGGEPEAADSEEVRVSSATPEAVIAVTVKSACALRRVFYIVQLCRVFGDEFFFHRRDIRKCSHFNCEFNTDLIRGCLKFATRRRDVDDIKSP